MENKRKNRSLFEGRRQNNTKCMAFPNNNRNNSGLSSDKQLIGSSNNIVHQIPVQNLSQNSSVLPQQPQYQGVPYGVNLLAHEGKMTSVSMVNNGLNETNRSILIGGKMYPAPHGAMMNQMNQMPTNVQQMSHVASHMVSIGGANPNFYSGTMIVKQGSNYSSPRSSLGSGGDSKNSSPRTSLTNPPPPPPYDQRFGSPRSSIASPRSSYSGTSFESKHSSPRTSLAGMSGLLNDKFPPSPRGSVVISQDSANYGHHFHPSIGYVRNIPVSIMSDHSRFNEHAPPPYSDPRLRTLPAQIQASVPITVSAMNNQNLQNSQGSHLTASGSLGGSISSLTGSLTSQTPPPIVPARIPIQQQQNSPSRQTEIEQTLATLTQQLEDGMRLTSDQTIPKKPPPPYHGPHKTEAVPVLPPRNPRYSSPTTNIPISHSQNFNPNQAHGGTKFVTSIPSQTGKNPPSVAVRPQAQLPYQVTTHSGKDMVDMEKKVAALTQQLEDEMEKSPQGEYFGKCHYYNVHLYSKARCTRYDLSYMILLYITSRTVYTDVFRVACDFF